MPTTSIILSTYNQPNWLEKVLWAYNQQTTTSFELIIADDGSGKATQTLISNMKDQVNYPIHHVWHEDDGFRKTIILNKAIRQAAADYLVFSDGDCLPRADFLTKHLTHRKPGHFLSGGYYKLPQEVSDAITPADIQSQDCFDINWLREGGLKRTFKNHKLTATGLTETLLNRLTPTGATWNGMNSSGWTKDILAVNGFDERMQYGGEDREMGERLMNNGIRPVQIRYSAICLHLHHERGYVKPEMLTKNAAIRATTKKERLTWTEFGLEK